MRQRFIALIFSLAVGLAPLAGAGTPPQEVDEYRVKAAFLLNFARFVEWPAGAFTDRDAPLRLCVIGKTRLGGHLDSLEGRLIKGRTVVIVEPGKSTVLARTCHVLFVSRSATDVPGIISDSVRHPILTVTEREDGEGAHGIINLVKVWSGSNDGPAERFRIVFEIDVAAAKTAGLEVGSRLLELALVRNNTQ